MHSKDWFDDNKHFVFHFHGTENLFFYIISAQLRSETDQNTSSYLSTNNYLPLIVSCSSHQRKQISKTHLLYLKVGRNELSELIFLFSFPCSIGSLKLITNLNIQISRIFRIWYTGQCPCNDITRSNRQCIFKIKHSLFPMGTSASRRCWKTHRFMAIIEITIEICHKCMHIVIAHRCQFKLSSKRSILLFHSLQVEGLY